MVDQTSGANAANPVPLGQHPATHTIWVWLDENHERLGVEKVARIGSKLRLLSSELWEADRG